MTSSVYKQTLDIKGTPIAADTDILNTNLPFTRELLKPGNAGLIRVPISLKFQAPAVDAIISIFNNGIFKGTANIDQGNTVLNDGLYRFDVDVEVGDNVNFRANAIIETVNELRSHLILD